MTDYRFDPADVDSVAVIGCGTMGYGIALEFARFGADVRIFDEDADALERAASNVAEALDTLAGRSIPEDRVAEVRARLSYEHDLAAAVGGVDLVTEAVTEAIDVKHTVFEQLDEFAPADAVLATNTSGLSITEIAGAVEDPARVLGTHWFNPPYIVPLVEVVEGEATDDDLAGAVYDLFEAMEKTPVRVEKDIPGFIGNRIQMAMNYEAFSLLDRGVASAEDIDRAVKAGFGFRLPIMGIFEKVDQSGVDVQYDIEDYLMPALDRGTEPNPVVSELVERGDHGLKTGSGVYDWTDVDPEAVYRERDEALLDMLELFRTDENSSGRRRDDSD